MSKNSETIEITFDITSKFGRSLLRTLLYNIRGTTVQYKPTPETFLENHSLGIYFSVAELIDDDDKYWQVGDGCKATFEYKFKRIRQDGYNSKWDPETEDWIKVPSYTSYSLDSKEDVSTLDVSPTIFRQMLVETLIRTAFTNDFVNVDCSDYGGEKINKIIIPELNRYIESDEHRIEDINMMELDIQKTDDMFPTDFNNYFKDGIQEKKIPIDCPIHTARDAVHAKIVEVFAFAYALKGLTREDFVGKYGEKYGRYWDKVTGGHVDVFLTNAAIEANKEIETLYNNLVKEWRKNIPIAQKDIDDLEKKIAAERKQFRETIQAEFERTVIDPLKELQQKRVEQCKADKAVAVENLRTEIKKCKGEMLEDIQKKVPIQKLLHISKDELKIRGVEFTV